MMELPQNEQFYHIIIAFLLRLPNSVEEVMVGGVLEILPGEVMNIYVPKLNEPQLKK